jgi:hypothetical protein
MLSLPELESRGQEFFQAFYGETADDVQGLLDRIYPDMGTHAMIFEHVILVLEQSPHRMVQQHNRLWLYIWLYWNHKSTGDIVRFGGHAHRGGYAAPDRLASRQCA